MAATARIAALAQDVIRASKTAGVKIATAESCTGGLIGGALTDVPGSSAAFDRGFIAYSNVAKTQMLGVPPRMIVKHGAVSAEVVRAMAEGALKASSADLVVAVTGIAGPEGGSDDRPVGLVWFGIATAREVRTEHHVFSGGSRDFVRIKTVETALELILAAIASL